jgi:hypothetical protein
MKLRKTAFAGAIAIAAVFVPLATSGVASATPIAQVCDPNDGPLCMNRAGAGTGNGTNVIMWNVNDNNNDFALVPLSSWCGGTGRVENGENGQVCPFWNGSGLNARYDQDQIYEIESLSTLKCAAISDLVGGGPLNLQPCGATGYAFVQSAAGYLISVGETNFQHVNNQPYWINAAGKGQGIITSPGANNPWEVLG